MDDWLKRNLTWFLWSLYLILPTVFSILAAKRSSTRIAGLGSLVVFVLALVHSLISRFLEVGLSVSWCSVPLTLIATIPFVGWSAATMAFAPGLRKQPALAGLITFIISVALIPVWFWLMLWAGGKFCHESI